MASSKFFSQFNSNMKTLFILISIIGLLSLSLVSIGESSVNIAQDAPAPFFHVHLLAPTSNPVRMQYAHLIERELENIGISCDLDLVNWNILGARATDQEVGTYSKGGYDICFFGMSLGTPTGHPGDSLLSVYGSTGIPPAGFNVMYWSPVMGKNYNNYRASESKDLIDQIDSNLNLTKTKSDLIDWQKIWYDVMPNVMIYNQYEVHAVSKGLYGYDPIKYPLNSIEDVWLTSDYTGTASQVVFAASTGGDTFNPMIATDVYDHYGNNPAFDGLVGYTPSKEAILPLGTIRELWMKENYDTTEYLAAYPRVAAAMGTYSANGLEYDINVRENVYWHDGHQLDAWDVAFSFQAHLTPDCGSSKYSNLVVPFGNDDKTNHHGTYSFVVSDDDTDGFYEHIKFNFFKTCPSFERDYLGLYLFPEHILGDPVNHGFDTNGDFDPDSTWLCRPGDWRGHSTTTGRTTDPSGYAGPIGCGSMIFESFDSTTRTVTFKKFENIRWDNATGTWVTDTLDHWNIANLADMPDDAKVIVASMDSAFADMKTGGVNIMDPQFTMANILDELQIEATIQPILAPETGWQSIYLNPKFVDDGVYHLQKKGVHHAVSHIVPREEIITHLLNGLGRPAYTPLPITSWGAISEADLTAYKKSLKATDGTTPESGATTANDEYSRDLAFDWLDTEGYDTSAWRAYIPPASPGWPTGDAQQWDSQIQNGTTISFNIDTVLNENDGHEWYWEEANVTFTEGNTINITWNSDPDFHEEVGPAGQVTYNITVTIGGVPLDADHSRQFGWFVLPLVTTDGFGEKESGIRAAERFFFGTFQLVNGPTSSSQNYWNFVVEDDSSLHNTGAAASPDGEIHANIITSAESTAWSPEIEDRVFNLTYDAQSGMLKYLTFTNTLGGDPTLGTVESYIVQGLKQLEIRRTTVSKHTSITEQTTSTEPALKTTPSWFLISTLIVLIVVEISWKRKK